jgi:hypothetical protein
VEVAGELVGLVAEGDLAVAEYLVVGQVHQGFGHLAGGLLQAGQDLLGQGLDTLFAIFQGRQSL